MCLPTGPAIKTDSLQEERREMESIQNQLQKLIGFNPVVVTSRRPKRALPKGVSAAVSTSTPAPTEKTVTNEWVLWEHKHTQSNDDAQELKQWQSQTSEVAHFFRSIGPHACDTTHVPSPSRTFTQPTPKGQKRQLTNNASTTSSKRGYSLFKKGIVPEWEDPKNANGGSWFIRQYVDPAILDSYWKNLIGGLVDQKTKATAEEPKKNVWRPKHRRGAASATKETNKIIFDHINGIRIDDKTSPYSQRAMYKIEIWIDTTDSMIREQVREWMLATMLNGRSHLRALRTNWKSFSVKVHNKDHDERSEATSTTATTSCSSSPSEKTLS